PESRLPFGSGSNALALSPDGGTLYVANGTNNCVAVVALGSKASEQPAVQGTTSTVMGLIPTGWYPGALLLSPDGQKLIVGNVKGHGSLDQRWLQSERKNSYHYTGSISIIDVPDVASWPGTRAKSTHTTGSVTA